MITRKIYKSITFKDGYKLPAGTSVQITPSKNPRLCVITAPNNHNYTVRYTSILKAPTEKTLMKWEYEGYCKSISGSKVEPDGIDEKDFPSWLLALSMI